MEQSSQDYLLSLLVNKTQQKLMRDNSLQQRPSPFLKFDKEGLVVKYTGKGLVYSDVTSVQAIHPVPKDTFIYYYEVLVHNIGARGDMCVGFADQDFPVNKHPGQTSKSIGYKSDGKVFIGRQETELKLPPYKNGDVLGCGINFLKREIFFTKDGQVLKTNIPMYYSQLIYPTVSLHALNQQLVFNFGAERFSFDIEAYGLIEKSTGVEKILDQPVSSYDVHKVVQEYLWRQGYTSTLNAFNDEAYLGENLLQRENSQQREKVDSMEVEREEQKQMEQEVEQPNTQIQKTPQSQQKASQRKTSGFESPNYMVFMRKESAISFEDFSINYEPNKSNKNIELIDNDLTQQRTFDKERTQLKQMVLEGDIENLIQILTLKFQDVIQSKPELLPLLHAQVFLELINKNDIIGAIRYAQIHLTKYQDTIFQKYDKNETIEDITIDSFMGILCYNKPEESSLADLLTQKQRELVADVLNKAMLKSQNCQEDSSLELIIKQLKQIGQRLKEESFFQGEIFEFKV